MIFYGIMSGKFIEMEIIEFIYSEYYCSGLFPLVHAVQFIHW